MKTINLLEFKETSPKARLKGFYSRLSALNMSGLPSSQKAELFKKYRGEFLTILREKCELGISDAAKFMKKTPDEVVGAELGEGFMSDACYFRFCGAYKASNEAGIFLEKMEEALKAGLRELRQRGASDLKTRGISFADASKYESSERGVLLTMANRGR